MAKLDLDRPRISPESWASVLDQLLLGVSHDISNRVATLAGVSDILSDDPTIPPILRALADEVPRLEEGIRLLRLLAAPANETEEALEATRLVDDAILLAHLHPDCRGVLFEVVGRREVPPVVARPTKSTHEIVVALIIAASEIEHAESEPGTVAQPVRIPISFSSDEHELTICAGSAVVRARLLIAGVR